MNINIFFLFIFTALMMIFVFFQPMEIKTTKDIEVATVETYDFVVHQLDTKGLTRIIKGKQAFIYKDRYKILDVDYTDATKKQIINLKAENGLYKDKTIKLNGNVRYTRDDGLIFKSQSLNYDEKTTVLDTKDNYVMYKDKNKVIGTSFKLDNNLEKIHSKNVEVTYQIGNNLWNI